MSVIEQIDPKTGLKYRLKTRDLTTIREQKCYDALGIGPDDTVLDIGGNIGAFAYRAASQHAKKVVSVEPDPDNFRLLVTNTLEHPQVVPVRAAVVDDSIAAEPIAFFAMAGGNKAMHSTVPVRGRRSFPVPTVGYKALFALHPFTVVKIDIEGGEYELPLLSLPETVTRLAIEYHLWRPQWRETAKKLDEQFATLGWQRAEEVDIDSRKLTAVLIYRR